MKSSAEDIIQQAQTFIGEDLEFSRLDQIFDLQRLIGPVIAMKILLSIALNSADDKEARLAASQLLSASGEDPSEIVNRLRASVFKDLTLAQLEAVVQTGITDPERALAKLQGVDSEAQT